MQSVDPDRWEGAETRLGRTVRATVAAAVATSSRPREHHRKTNWLRDVILGGQDGLVNILGIEEYLYGVVTKELPASFGQEPLKANLRVAIEAAKGRAETLDHLLLYGQIGRASCRERVS